MSAMTSYEPDPKTAQLFGRYKRAVEAERELKPDVRTAAETAIRNGASNQELATLTGLTPEFFRKLAQSIGVDNRRKAPTVGREVEARRAGTQEHAPPTARTAAPVTKQAVPKLTDKQAAELAARAFATADPHQFQALTKAADQGDRAVIEAALELGALNQTDLLTA